MHLPNGYSLLLVRSKHLRLCENVFHSDCGNFPPVSSRNSNNNRRQQQRSKYVGRNVCHARRPISESTYLVNRHRKARVINHNFYRMFACDCQFNRAVGEWLPRIIQIQFVNNHECRVRIRSFFTHSKRPSPIVPPVLTTSVPLNNIFFSLLVSVKGIMNCASNDSVYD